MKNNGSDHFLEQRNRIAGRHLGRALKILGKTWRKKVHDPNHVLRWPEWTALDLPRSPTTIDADIRLGVPARRMDAYSQCLGISPRLFGAPDTDILSILSVPDSGGRGPSNLLMSGFATDLWDEYIAHNPAQYIRELFGLMQGVYRVHYALPAFSIVNRCAFWIHSTGRHLLKARGLFVRFGLENPFEAHLFRWHNNLHATYLCQNRKELGYFLLIDPLRHNLVYRRAPFWMKGTGLTDSGLTDNMPINFFFRMEKLPVSRAKDSEALWAGECAETRKFSPVREGEHGYKELLARIMEPDDLSAGPRFSGE